MKEMIKNTLIILAITVVAGACLGLVNEATKDTIAFRQDEAKRLAYSEVFADAADFELREITISDDARMELDKAGYAKEELLECFDAVDSEGNVLGNVFSVVTHEGYGGDIEFTVGIRNDGTVNGISLLSINETAGLGMNAEKVLVPQFAGKMVDYFRYVKTGKIGDNEIDAISGATITTNAITNGVNMSIYLFNNYVGGGNHE